MRISSDSSDKAYCQMTADVKVFLNKQEVKHVVTADEDLGIVIVYLKNNGKFSVIRHKQEVRTLTLTGEVNIYLGPRTKRHLKFLEDNNLDNFGGKR